MKNGNSSKDVFSLFTILSSLIFLFTYLGYQILTLS